MVPPLLGLEIVKHWSDTRHPAGGAKRRVAWRCVLCEWRLASERLVRLLLLGRSHGGHLQVGVFIVRVSSWQAHHYEVVYRCVISAISVYVALMASTFFVH